MYDCLKTKHSRKIVFTVFTEMMLSMWNFFFYLSLEYFSLFILLLPLSSFTDFMGLIRQMSHFDCLAKEEQTASMML